MPYSPEHPSDWTLELLAEGALSPEEVVKVSAHAQRCERCAAEVEGYRSLFAAMATLPRLAPSASFEEAVMARVKMAPQAMSASWLVRWLPATRRGWALLMGLSLAPALPIVALVAWLASQPLVTPGSLWDAAAAWMGDAGWSLLVGALGGFVDSSAVAWGRALAEQVLEVPPEVLIGGVLLLAVGIPLSVWILYRTLRTPTGGTLYAH